MSSILRNIIKDIEKGMADTTAKDIERYAWKKGREIDYSMYEKMAKIERYTWKKALQIVRKGLPEEREVWLNIYEDIIYSSPTRKEADANHSKGRVARVKIVLKDVEGRFDE